MQTQLKQSWEVCVSLLEDADNLIKPKGKCAYLLRIHRRMAILEGYLKFHLYAQLYAHNKRVKIWSKGTFNVAAGSLNGMS